MEENDDKELEEEEKDSVTANRVAHELESKERTEDIMIEEYSKQINNNSTVVPSFADMGLSIAVLRGLRAAGFQRPSPVQVKAIPLGRLGIDLIVQAKSGTGKTVVFSIIALETIDVKQKAVQAIVLSPTREIAFQSADVIRQLGHYISGLGVQLFVGGIPLADDIKNLHRCQIAVGTPGRIKYLINAGHLNCDAVKLFILDEADLLFSGGASLGPGGITDEELLAGRNTFPGAINYIWWALPEAKQVIALSATYSEHLVGTHLPRYMRSPALVRLSAHDPALLGVRQFFSKVSVKSPTPSAVFKAKVKELLRIVKEIDFKQCLVFSNFHNSAEHLCESLRNSGWPVNYISSGLDQKERFKAFNSLRAFQCRILVSTDLTSRGIDAENVNLVINLEIPWNRDIYLHRIGRAGRFGSYGASIILVGDTEDELKQLSRIENPDSTPICELPDPIPADLATADCPVDLSKLVTVTKLTQDLENMPTFSASNRPNFPRTNRKYGSGEGGKGGRKPVQMSKGVKNPTAPGPELDSEPMPLKKASPSKPSVKKTSKKSKSRKSSPGLLENLKNFTDYLLNKPPIRVYLSTDPVPEQQPESPDYPAELESNLLHQISQFISGKPIEASSESSESENDEEESFEGIQYSEGRNFSNNAIPVQPQFIPQQNWNIPNIQVPQQVYAPQQPTQQILTPRQTFIWNEYCRLLQWKDYYFQEWLKVTQEYDAVWLEYQELTGQRSENNGVDNG